MHLKIWHFAVVVIGALIIGGAVVGGALYYFYPIQVSTVGGLGRDYMLSLNAPPGKITTEANRAYKSAHADVPALAANAQTPGVANGDWPSYNRTLTSERFSPLNEINTTNAAELKVLCTYDVGQFAAFETGLVMVKGALIGTTEFDTFSLDPSTCALNWRTHEVYPPALLSANRGVAYLDGMLFRGTQDGRVLAYDFENGKRIWETRIADPKHGETVPAAPIAWNGLVFIGNAGGDYKGGKGHMFALDAKTGKIVWEFFTVPRSEGDVVRGPLGASPLDSSTWDDAMPISGGGLWTSYTLDPKTGLLYVPVGNAGPDYAIGSREGEDSFTDSIVVLDAGTGNYKSRFQLLTRDWHDWDASNPPPLIHTRGGKRLMAAAPKDGYLYGFDLATNSRLYRTPVTRIDNVEEPFTPGKDVHFCPGAGGGDEWNSPGYDPQTNLIIVGEVDWCVTVEVQDREQLQSVADGQPWFGDAALNPFFMAGKFSRADNNWAGWVYAADADSGVWKWRVKSNYPVIGGITPTAGGVVFFGDVGGNFLCARFRHWKETLGPEPRRRRDYLYGGRPAESGGGGRPDEPRLAGQGRASQDRRAGPRKLMTRQPGESDDPRPAALVARPVLPHGAGRI